uniref:RE59362p n=1 Tax=Drosophila melanogaster TaxID=7227 RepID=Q5BIH0_DROME|nr:RE59362p [Drosophila melanogaster]
MIMLMTPMTMQKWRMTNQYNPRMNTIHSCGCMGVRTCLSCEQDFQVAKSCLGESVLSLMPYEVQQPGKYNLDLVASYEDELLAPLLTDDQFATFEEMVLRIPLPNLCLIVLYGPG